LHDLQLHIPYRVFPKRPNLAAEKNVQAVIEYIFNVKQPGSGNVGFVVDKVALGQVFSKYFSFPCQSSFHRLLQNYPHLSSGAGTIGQKWPQYLVDLVPPH
jgi:hypothetical protein